MQDDGIRSRLLQLTGMKSRLELHAADPSNPRLVERDHAQIFATSKHNFASIIWRLAAAVALVSMC